MTPTPNEARFCTRCGAEAAADSVFCYRCGAPLNNANPVDPNAVNPNYVNPNYVNPNMTPVPQPATDQFYDQPFIHESDRKALKALKAIPGFTPLMKAFIKHWNEKQFKIINLSSNIRIDENQMPEIYNMLPPICEKLHIEVPEIYLELDVVPNAYTYGDTKPFIVITSGLLETIPMELLPTVIAHECGHIACHHVLYSTIAGMLINGASAAGSYFGLGKLVSLPLQVAFYHWKRCSELSADRAAAYCDGTADNIIEMCMRFAGYDRDLNLTASKELFMKQADDYKDMIDSSKWDKTMEFLVVANRSHPFNAVRASECNAWAQTPEFQALIARQS
ncbi:MAG: M48 family metalloprotease [Eubacterium sp.]|nr:M48 family metalloprotease [Eubacterium sp.]